MSGGLFPDALPDGAAVGASIPLAERMRPAVLADVVGQPALRDGAPLRRLIDSGTLPSILLFGPPGSGKTTIARLLAATRGARFVQLSAVLAGVKDLRALIADAEERRAHERTVLFVDEIHHFNKSQQDALLPHVESGAVVLVGATTENPSFHVNAALLSRCTTVMLEPLDTAALRTIAVRALGDPVRGLGSIGITLEDDTLDAVIATSHGDARSLLNRLEALVGAAASSGTARRVPDAEARELLFGKLIAHDKSGDQHYDLASALHKSVRGGDPQAALYWLARSLLGGEEPLYVCRRLVRMAVEDIGLADPQALRVALDATDAFRFLGSPEGDLVLAQAAVYLATAPKSNAIYSAFGSVKDAIDLGAVYPVPLHLRNAPTRLMKQHGLGAGYRYPHDFDGGIADQDHLPDALRGHTWYVPSPYGHEKDIAKRMAWWDELRRRIAPGATAGDQTGG